MLNCQGARSPTVHEAFSLGTTATFTVGIGTALLAALVILVVLPAARMRHAEGRSAVVEGNLEPSAD